MASSEKKPALIKSRRSFVRSAPSIPNRFASTLLESKDRRVDDLAPAGLWLSLSEADRTESLRETEACSVNKLPNRKANTATEVNAKTRTSTGASSNISI